MNLNYRYKYECDSYRLLINEFKIQLDKYNLKNERYINEMSAHDLNEYQPPKYLSNYKAILTSSLLIEAQALLDFFVPIIINYLARVENQNISPFDNTWKKGNVLCWTKYVLNKELSLKYDFSGGLYCKLKEFYEFRNDQIHYGGYISSDKKRRLLTGKKGIMASRYSDLYVIEFSYCESLINDIENFFIEIHKSIET
jgi:hypothetical protein